MNDPTVHAQMLIRRPVTEVFNAFINPDITTNFWFTKSSGPIETGSKLRWEWEMYGVGTDVTVKSIEANRRILIEWDDPPELVEWRFAARDDGHTLVEIENSGFNGEGDDATTKAIDSMGGFTMVLAGAKAWLEHGIALNLIADHFPDAHSK